MTKYFVAWRALLFGFDFIALAYTTQRSPNPNAGTAVFPGSTFWDGFFRWDSGWYTRIAERGYFIEGPQSDVAFFPLYPYLSRYLGVLLGNHHVAGLLISNLATLGALYFIFRIAERQLSPQVAERSILFLLVFPASFFLSAYYSEGLYLLTISASIYYFLDGRYLPAGVFGALAAATRSSGSLLFPVFVACSAHEILKRRRAFERRMVWLGLIPLGLVAFMAMLAYQVGDPLAFLEYQAGWGRSTTFPLLTAFRALEQANLSFPRNPANTQGVLDALVALGAIGCSLYLIRRAPPVLWSYALATILLPLSTGLTASLMRYVAVIFPVFYALALMVRTRFGELLLTAAFAMFLGLYSVRFMNWFWAG